MHYWSYRIHVHIHKKNAKSFPLRAVKVGKSKTEMTASVQENKSKHKGLKYGRDETVCRLSAYYNLIIALFDKATHGHSDV